jgi:hypothetical protein
MSSHSDSAVVAVAIPDLSAEALLRDARARRWVFPDEEFTGFRADVTLQDDSRTFTGTLELKTIRDQKLNLPGADPEILNWLRGILAMNIAHRLQRTGGMPVPTDYPVRFEAGAENALGPKIVFEGDPLGSSYRIRDGVITEVHRNMHGSLFTITTLETVAGADGRIMPKHYVVTYFDPEKKTVIGVAQYTELYASVEGIYLPTYIRVIETSGATTTVRVIELNRVALL